MTAPDVTPRPSASLKLAGYWWYEARGRLLHRVFGAVTARGATVVDVGSADGPSVAWLDQSNGRIGIDIDPEGLRPGDVCASALRLPFAENSVEYLSAFDVVEHFPDEGTLLGEFRRVLTPGGQLFLSVPAYQWAWSAFDVRSGHYRRYTRGRIRRALRAAGFEVERATYAFAGTLPFFVMDRLRLRLTRATSDQARPRPLPAWLNRSLLVLTRLDEALLGRVDLPFGSSVLVVARRPGEHLHGGARRGGGALPVRDD